MIMRLFLDSCVIIYWVEAKEPYYSSFITKLSNINDDYPNARIVVSRLSLLECFVLPLREKNKSTYKLYQDFFSNPDIEIIELDAKVVEVATQLRADYHLKTPDAIQAASAFSLHGKMRFITNDKRFKAVPNLNIISI